jgi:hypothetical protein
MNLALIRRPRSLPLSRAGIGSFDAANRVCAVTPADGTCYRLQGVPGKLAASAAIRWTTAEPRPLRRLATEPPRPVLTPGQVACFIAAPLAAPPPASDSS